ncbi:uncharacterized protein Triagg1_4303 [Trichoderma aggressivum f. europaeum]|uniref:Uncharacterized protein n=1 Tax=Trichoderma aggressivum f. europaeum TaxID=173218 RepID=A0AAE1JBN8_9HYPO|nr:hypothetical protein Triagg1_4303 [Trichoderma aggressivum f. europaeum]
MSGLSRLESLPQELISHICRKVIGHLNDHIGDLVRIRGDTQYDTPSLASLCRTSTRLRDIATPVLYSRFTTLRGAETAMRFLATISLRPDLAQYVEKLDLCQGTSMEEIISQRLFETTRVDGNMTMAEWLILSRAAAYLGLDYIYPPIDLGEFATIVQLILAYTPSVKSVHIATMLSGTVYDKWGYTILQSLADQRPRRVSLAHLRYLYLEHVKDMNFGGSFCLQYFAAIFELAPSIETLHMNPCSGINLLEQVARPRISLANVTTLSLNQGDTPTNAVRWMVGDCAQLQHFRYFGSEFPAMDGVTPREIIQILQLHKDNLISLSILLKARTWSEFNLSTCMPLFADGEQIVSLKDFSKLEVF